MSKHILAIVVALFCSASILASTPPAKGAELRVVRANDGFEVLISGEIENSGVARLGEELRALRYAHEPSDQRKIVAVLDSDGGDFNAGIELAALFQELAIATDVRAGARCLSACAIAFLGGSRQPENTNRNRAKAELPPKVPDRSISVDAKVGFHAPFLPKVGDGVTSAVLMDAAYAAAVKAMTRLATLVDNFHVSVDVLPTLLRPTRDGFFYVDADAAGYLTINVYGLTDKYLLNARETRSGISNACINRFYHEKTKFSSVSWFKAAEDSRRDFVRSSMLLNNSEETGDFMLLAGHYILPVAVSSDGKRFVWCAYAKGNRLKFVEAGRITDLAPEIGNTEDAYESVSITDYVPPQTELSRIDDVLLSYLETDEILSFE